MGIVGLPAARLEAPPNRAADHRADPHRARPPRAARTPGHVHHAAAPRAIRDADPSPGPGRPGRRHDNDVLEWRDEALMLNLASFGPDEHQLFIQAGIDGLRDILDLELDPFRDRLHRAAAELNVEPPTTSPSTVGGTRRGPSRRSRGRRSRTPRAGRDPRTGYDGRWTPRRAVRRHRHRRRDRARHPGRRDRPCSSTRSGSAFEQGRAEAAAWTGFTGRRPARATDAILADLVVGPPDFDVEIAGEPVLDQREQAHMRDVRGVFVGFFALTAVPRSRASWSSPPRTADAGGRRGGPSEGGARPHRGISSRRVRPRRLRHPLRDLPRVFFAGGSYTFDPATSGSSSSSRSSSGRRPRSCSGSWPS